MMSYRLTLIHLSVSQDKLPLAVFRVTASLWDCNALPGFRDKCISSEDSYCKPHIWMLIVRTTWLKAGFSQVKNKLGKSLIGIWIIVRDAAELSELSVFPQVFS